MKTTCLLTVSIALMFSAPAVSQDVPNAPSVMIPHLLTITQLAVSAADAAYTYHDSQKNFVELNPVMRPFVTRGPALLAASFAVSAAVPICAGYWLEHRGHRKLALAVRLFGIAGNAQGAVQSYRDRKYH